MLFHTHRFSVIKMLILPELTDSRQFISETQQDFFIGFDELILKFMWNNKGTKSKDTAKEEPQNGEITLLHNKICKSAVIKMGLYAEIDEKTMKQPRKRLMHIWKVDFWHR